MTTIKYFNDLAIKMASRLYGFSKSSKIGIYFLLLVLIYILAAAVVIILFKLMLMCTHKLFNKLEEKQDEGIAHLQFLRSVTTAALKIAFILLLMKQLGIKIGSLLTFLGAAGLSLSLALKEDIENFSAGLSILLAKRIDVGKKIKVESNIKDIEGEVVRVTLMYTILNRGGKEIIVPNSFLARNPIIKGKEKEEE